MNRFLDDSGFLYRQMELDDLDDVLDIERQSFRTPWTPDMFITEFANPRSRRRVLLDAEGRLAGYMLYWVILDEAHLMNIAVAPDLRQQGAGTRLVANLIQESRRESVEVISLEVRVSNLAAIRLYQKFGFQPVGLRKNYYTDEGEDALLMELEL